jgi:hypothetical protein
MPRKFSDFPEELIRTLLEHRATPQAFRPELHRELELRQRLDRFRLSGAVAAEPPEPHIPGRR